MVTDWIQAVAGVLTLCTAIAAGIGAWRAAHWTKEQAQATANQVDVARQAVRVAEDDAAVARAQADDQRREAARAARRLAEDRIDQQMPTVLIRATPSTTRRPFLEDRLASNQWAAVDEEIAHRDVDALRVLRVNVGFQLQNLSDRIARVVVIDPAWGQYDLGPEGVLVLPHDVQTFAWWRVVTSSEARLPEVQSQLSNTRAKLRVYDLGRNAYDIVDVVLDVRLFKIDGSWLYVSPSNGWEQSIGTPLPGRVYDRLDAEAQTDENQAAGAGS